MASAGLEPTDVNVEPGAFTDFAKESIALIGKYFIFGLFVYSYSYPIKSILVSTQCLHIFS